MKITRDLPIPKAALAIGAHPDDIEFNCGSTVAKWSSKGCEFHFAILTDGSMGSWEPTDDSDNLIETRQAEARRAANLLGVESSNVHFLGFNDGSLEKSRESIARVCSLIRTVKPQTIFGHDPWKMYRLHPDHRAAGFITVDAIVAAREPLYSYLQTLEHHRCDNLLLYEAQIEDHVESSKDFEEQKVESLLAHASQLLTTMNIAGPNDLDGIERFRRWISDNLTEKGSLATLSGGEAFKLINQI